MLIAFCGVDGSGKTTNSRKLHDYLKKKGKKVILIKPFEYLFLRRFSNKKSSSKILNKKNKPFYYKFWAFFALIDNLLYYLINIRPLIKKYDYVVCDRYFYDFLTSFEHYGFIFKWFYKVYLSLVPKPNLLFVLNAPPKIALRREREDKHLILFYKNQSKRYKIIGQKFGVFLDTSEKNVFPDIKDYLKPLI